MMVIQSGAGGRAYAALEVSAPFSITCPTCQGSGWVFKSWHYQPEPGSGNKEFRIVEACIRCNAGSITVVTLLGPGHRCTFVPHSPPDLDNNYQGTLKCESCSRVIMG